MLNVMMFFLLFIWGPIFLLMIYMHYIPVDEVCFLEKDNGLTNLEKKVYNYLLFKGHYVETSIYCDFYRIPVALPFQKIAVMSFTIHPDAERERKAKAKAVRRNGWTLFLIPDIKNNKFPRLLKELDSIIFQKTIR
ncbi:hypothetical protein GJU40_00790 [Bacillus lacus]|uniref:DUF559 domain-containing protein n=1 Tax=Metabacillus lacus TaxID=1983721 RepID=A0A7X2IW46_9BACI|nr:hypothetical protein [Metabacillus lacus]MRX70705.1 hypothetical protein [Metabacillus lacus]